MALERLPWSVLTYLGRLKRKYFVLTDIEAVSPISIER